MKKYIITTLLLSTFLTNTHAQSSNGQVNSLVAAENYFAGLAKEKGIKRSFLAVSDDHTILFRPDPVKDTEYFQKQAAPAGELSWNPVFAKISKSGDWGFTTGPYTFKPQPDSNIVFYGQYVSVWKMNKKGIWKLATDMGISHDKPKSEPALNFTDPQSRKYLKHPSSQRLQQREDMILTSDKLFSKTLKNYKNLAYNVFLADDARLLFPGYEPIIGKEKVTDFLRLQELQVSTEPAAADRAPGSDLAYTYGTALITHQKETKAYNYMRIWEVQTDHKWNVILEVFSPAATKE